MSEYNRLPTISRKRTEARKRRKSPRERQEELELGIGAITELPKARG